jgi:release factor glutamine methyltransferase
MSAWAAAREAALQLREAGIDEASFEAEYLARVASGLDRARFFAGADLDPEAADRFAMAVGRRLAREPAAYIAGEREFAGRWFEVTPDVLVPRPETELLVEIGVNEAERWLSARPIERPVVVDVGTGSGCIAVAVALSAPRARVIGLDVSAGTLAVASRNASKHDARITLVRADLLTSIRRADIVLANLPYIPTADIAALDPEVRDWEPGTALDGGPDGLAFIRRLISDCGARLRPTLLALEVGIGQAGAVGALARAAGAVTSVRCDLAGIERVVIARWE